MQRRYLAIGTTALALAAFPATALADDDDLQVASQTNTSEQKASGSATAKSGHTVIIGNGNTNHGGDNIANAYVGNSNKTTQEIDQDQGGGGGDDLQVGSQYNENYQNAKCSATAKSGHTVIIGNGNKNYGGDNEASCSAKNENETTQTIDQEQGGHDKSKRKHKKGKKGDKAQIADQYNENEQKADCYSDARSGDTVVLEGKKAKKAKKQSGEYKGGKNKSSCKAENENETDQEVDQDQD